MSFKDNKITLLEKTRFGNIQHYFDITSRKARPVIQSLLQTMFEYKLIESLSPGMVVVSTLLGNQEIHAYLEKKSQYSNFINSYKEDSGRFK